MIRRFHHPVLTGRCQYQQVAYLTALLGECIQLTTQVGVISLQTGGVDQHQALAGKVSQHITEVLLVVHHLDRHVENAAQGAQLLMGANAVGIHGHQRNVLAAVLEHITGGQLAQRGGFAGTGGANQSDHTAGINGLFAQHRDAMRQVRQQQGTIDEALDELPSALRSLDAQREDLVTMLESLNELGDVGVRVIEQSKDTTIETFRQLQPVLTELANSGDAFVKAFNVFLTYPFVDEVVGRDPQVARNLHMGDYTNLSVELEVDLSLGLTGVPTSLPTLLPTELEPTAVVGAVLNCLTSGDLTSKACQKVLADVELLLQLREECAKPKNEDVVVCTLLNQVPGLPAIGGLNELELPLLGGGLGLNRPAPGDGREPSGPQVADLAALYDADLVGLMIPGMVVS